MQVDADEFQIETMKDDWKTTCAAAQIENGLLVPIGDRLQGMLQVTLNILHRDHAVVFFGLAGVDMLEMIQKEIVPENEFFALTANRIS